jgi:two-component system repressor protein LuxO
MAEMAAGRFREDLFYRLHVVPVELPPLRERDGDVLLIARAFLETFAREDGRGFRGFAPDVEAALRAYHWPGNVRQLQNVVRSVVVLNDGPLVTLDMLPPELALSAPVARRPLASAGFGREIDAPVPDAPSAQEETPASSPDVFLDRAQDRPQDRPQDRAQDRTQESVAPAHASALFSTAPVAPAPLRPLETVIRETIEQAIERCGGSIPKAAAALDVSPSTLYRRLQSWDEAAAGVASAQG